MKTTLLTLLGVLLFFPIWVNTQNKTNKIKTYKGWVTLIDGSKEKGILYSADSEGIIISEKPSFDFSNLKTIEAKQIDKIKIRKKGNVGKGVLIGALSGVAFGWAISLNAQDDEPGWFSATKEQKKSGAIIGMGI